MYNPVTNSVEKIEVISYEKELPLEPEEFSSELLEFAKTEKGQQLINDRIIAFSDEKLKYFEVIAISNGK